MKKALLLLLVSFLFWVSQTPAAAQHFHRMGHANRSKTIKSDRTNKHIKHRDKKKIKKHKPDNGESRRHKEAKRQAERRGEASSIPETPEPEKTEP